MPSLSDMPDVVMDIILDKVGLRTLMTLRKVSHSLRDYIDESVPDTHSDTFQIISNGRYVQFIYMKDLYIRRINYLMHENGCMVNNERREQYLPNTDHFSAFFSDFAIILKHQKSILKRFHLTIMRDRQSDSEVELLEGLKQVLNQLKVEHVHIGIPQQFGFLPILQCLNANVLEGIELANSTYSYSNLKLDQIMLLDHWKRARKISLQYFMVTVDIQNFIHCDKIVVNLQTFSIKDLELLKKIAIDSLSFEAFFIHYNNFDTDLTDSLGIPYSIEDDEKIWYFKTKRNNTHLKIILFPSSKNISFVNLNSSDVPNNLL